MSASTRYRPTVARIDLGALRRNARLIRARIAPGSSILAAVKADAYGHGLVPVAQVLAAEGVDWFGVAIVEEGLWLRRAGVQTPVLVLGGFADGSEPAALEAGLTPVVYRSASARALNQLGARRGLKVPIHLKIDTGMHRLGVQMHELAEFLELLAGLSMLSVEGVLTHLSDGEDVEGGHTRQQLEDFADAVRLIRSRGHDPTWIHAANSGALMLGREPSGLQCNLVRPGIALYGVPTDASLDGAWPIEPVLSFESAISFIKTVPAGSAVSYGRTWRAERESRIAVLPVGYGDGYPRALGNCAEALVRGRRVPVVGRVCMDLTMLDVSDVPLVREGDRVVLLGPQGREEVTALELAALQDTIPYEVLCGVSPRVPRHYRDLVGPIDVPDES